MDIWEYKVIRMAAVPGQPLLLDEAQLQFMGSQGWELVNVVTIESKSRGMGGKLLIEGSLATSICDFVFKRRR